MPKQITSQMLFVLLTLQNTTDKKCQSKFHNFKLDYRKKYQNPEEEQQALYNFCFNWKLMRQLQSENKGLQLKINDHFDTLPPQNIQMAEPYNAMKEQQFEHQITNRRKQLPLIKKVGETGDGEIPVEKDIESYQRSQKEMMEVDIWCRGQQGYGYTSMVTPNQFADMYMQDKDGNNISLADLFIKLHAAVPDSSNYSVDLREWGTAIKSMDQGLCGSCYQFASRYGYTSSFLHDLQIYKQYKKGIDRENFTLVNISQKYVDTFLKLDSGTVRLSVQFQLNNSFSLSGNQYCSGGNFAAAAQDMGYANAEAIELEKNAPYTALATSDNLTYTEENRPDQMILKSDEFKHAIIRPFYSFYRQVGNACPKNIVGIRKGSDNDRFDQVSLFIGNSAQNITITADRLLELLLNLGVTVVSRMYLSDDVKEASKFRYYSKGIVPDGECKKWSSNHQVTFVGYGHYRGIPVWVLQNSWGGGWGVSGYYYIQRENNTFCHEMDFQAFLPQYLVYDGLDEAAKPFNLTALYGRSIENKTLYNVFNQSVKRGYAGLDNYNKDGPISKAEVLGMYKWLIAGIALVLVVIWLYQVIRCSCCQIYQVLRPAIYLNIKENKLGTYNWDNIENPEVDFELQLEDGDVPNESFYEISEEFSEVDVAVEKN